MAQTTKNKTADKTALDILKDDHRTVKNLFAEFEKSGPRAKKQREGIVRKVIEALSVHAAIEEMIFYPEVRRRVDSTESDVLEALEEHHVVKWTLSELDGMSADDERFAAKMAVLMEMVAHHVKEEEGELFPRVRAAIARPELIEMGRMLTSGSGNGVKATSSTWPRSASWKPGGRRGQRADGHVAVGW